MTTSVCDHKDINNTVKIYLTFENTGIDHETHFISGVKCHKCNKETDFMVKDWAYSEENKLIFEVEVVEEKIKDKLTQVKYRHFPKRIKKEMGKIRYVKDLKLFILKIMPNRLTKWVINSFIKGIGKTDNSALEDPYDFIEKFWKSLLGYARKIIKQEKSPIWI